MRWPGMKKKKKSVLEHFIDAISAYTGLPICVYDLDYFTRDDEKLNLPASLREHRSAFCLKVKSSREGWARCIKDQYARAEMANQMKRPLLHTCHAGVTDLVVPLRRGGKQIGVLFMGQAVTIPPAKAHRKLEHLSRKFGLNLAELKSLHLAQPHMSMSALQKQGDLLNGLRDYIETKEILLSERKNTSLNMARPLKLPVNMRVIPTHFLDQLQPQSPPIQQAVQILREGYWKDLILPTVARSIGFSESHFSREFMREIHLSFRKCLVEARINAAMYLLKRSSLSIGQIAELVGYNDFSSLTRAFQRQTGRSPREFKRMQPPPWLIDCLDEVPRRAASWVKARRLPHSTKRSIA